MDLEDAAKTMELAERLTGGRVAKLEAELAAEKSLNRNLWLVVAKLQNLAGMAYCWTKCDEVTAAESESFCDMNHAADKILDGLISLDPVEK